MKKVIGGVLGGLAGIITVTAAAYMPFVIGESKKNHNDKCEYLMILGGNVIGEDTPSAQLLERMKAAVKYLSDNSETIAVACGGCFRENQKKSEARIIADYLIDQGISPERIILEDRSTTTFENFEFAKRLVENHAVRDIDDISVAFLSSNYHVYRASKIAKLCGIERCGKVSCPTPGKALPRFAREYIVAYELFYKTIEKKFG